MKPEIKYFVVGVNNEDRFNFVGSIHNDKNYLRSSFAAKSSPIPRLIQLETSLQARRMELILLDVPMNNLSLMADNHTCSEGCILVIGEDNQAVPKLQTIMKSYLSWINNLIAKQVPVDRYPKLIAVVPIAKRIALGPSTSKARNLVAQRSLFIDKRNDPVWSHLEQQENVEIVCRQLKHCNFDIKQAKSRIGSSRKQSGDAIINTPMDIPIAQTPEPTIGQRKCCYGLCQTY